MSTFSMAPSIYWLGTGLLLVLAQDFLRRIRLPVAALIIVLGMWLGPLGVAWLHIGRFESVVTEAAVVLVLFAIGFQLRWGHFLAAIRPGLVVGLTGIAASVVLGFLASYSVTGRVDEALYIGVALAATSIGLSVPVLNRAGVLASRAGQILLAAAIVDDIVALYLLSSVHLSLSSDGAGQVFVASLLSLLVLFLVCLLVRLARWCLFHFSFSRSRLWRRMTMVLLALLSALATHWGGLSLAVGGFVAGAVLSVSSHGDHAGDSDFFDRLSNWLLPLFFLSIGMQITTLNLEDPQVLALTSLVLLAALAGKLFCPWLIDGGLSLRERWLLGVSLLPRGEVGLVVAGIGLQQQHLSHHGMVALVMMTLVTALGAALAIPWLAKGIRVV
ncbi:cation:proton antiporter [Pseudomonas arcuscaelestis]|uniref:cation:proton antiporter n=1 Tax=Pseudomonas arcuscaelestis TaxID=2710591 RepID=UPI002E2D851B|nr:cation:proton antiporter [Pseudomonas arcuscaelestis]